MNNHFTGILSGQEPLHSFLANQVMRDVLGYRDHRPVFEGFSLDSSATVFRFVDQRSFVSLVAKFYGNKWINGSQTGDVELRAKYMQREFDNLQKLRQLGLDAYPHAVVRPLAVSQDFNCVLVEEFVPGTGMDFYVWEAIERGKASELYEKLSDLAWFLADLHARSQEPKRPDPIRGLDYFLKVIDHLSHWNIITTEQRQRFLRLRQRWEDSEILDESGSQVLTHGDPIFPHFICHGEHGITSIDLERAWPGDPAMDIGCVVAELKHLFYLHCHDLWAGEPYIRHFYNRYSERMQHDNFVSLTARGRFYMGCYELRISRNAWLNLDYRHALINEAEACLQI